MFDARLLSVFREVATRGSFSEAALALSFTQPAVSQQIARLERELGTRLLARNAHGVTPTPAGAVLLRHAEAVLAQLREAEAEVQAVAGVERPPPRWRRRRRAAAGAVLLRHAEAVLAQLREAEAEVQAVAGVERPRLRVGAFASAAASIMPPALAALRAAHPAAEVTMRLIELPDSVDALRTGELDMILFIDSELTPFDVPAGVQAVQVLDDPMLVALPYSHRLAGRGAIALADLRDEEWMLAGVGGTCPDSNVVLRSCRDAGFSPQITFTSEDYGAIQGMVASGMGVALIPSLALVSAREDIAIRSLRDANPTRRVHATVATDRPSALGDALLDILRTSGRDRRWAGRQLAAVA